MKLHPLHVAWYTHAISEFYQDMISVWASKFLIFSLWKWFVRRLNFEKISSTMINCLCISSKKLLIPFPLIPDEWKRSIYTFAFLCQKFSRNPGKSWQFYIQRPELVPSHHYIQIWQTCWASRNKSKLVLPINFIGHESSHYLPSNDSSNSCCGAVSNF